MESNAINVGDLERVFSATSGAAIAIYGLNRGSFSGLAMSAIGGMLLHRGITGFCLVYDTLEVDTSISAPELRSDTVEIAENMTIKRPRNEVYEAWRDLEKLPRFMRHITSVKQTDDRHSKWSVRLPKGMGTIEWDSEIIEELPNELIAWQSLPDADLQNAGKVVFQDAPGKRGTEITVNIEYRPPAGRLGRTAAGLANPAFSKIVREDIRRFKAFMETGEIPTIEGQPSGR